MPTSRYKEQKVEELFKQLAAEFLLRESSGRSLVTVTAVQLTNRLSKATIFITAFPEEEEGNALDFARRKRTEFREYIKTRAKMRSLPSIDFEIDIGEKNRQRIDEIDAAEKNSNQAT